MSTRFTKYKKSYKIDGIHDKLNEARKKKIDYRQFELFDERDRKSKLDGETKSFLRRLKIEKNVLIKRDL